MAPKFICTLIGHNTMMAWLKNTSGGKLPILGVRLLLPCRMVHGRDAKIPTKITISMYHDITEYVKLFFIVQFYFFSFSLSKSIDYRPVICRFQGSGYSITR